MTLRGRLTALLVALGTLATLCTVGGSWLVLVAFLGAYRADDGALWPMHAVIGAAFLVGAWRLWGLTRLVAWARKPAGLEAVIRRAIAERFER